MQLERCDDVTDPNETENGASDDCDVKYPNSLISKLVAKKPMFGVEISQTPIVTEIPYLPTE
jgi:hypothetical protein